MDAPPSASAMAGGWDINSSQPASAPALHFTSPFEIKPPTNLDSHSQLKSHLTVGLAPAASLAHNFGEYLANHSHRLMIGSNFGQPLPMIGLRHMDTGYFMKDYVNRSEDISSLFEQSRASRRGDDDIAATDVSDGTGLSAPAASDSRFHNEADVSIACVPQFSSKLLPILAVEKDAYGTNGTDVKAEERGNVARLNDKNEDVDDDDDDEDEDNDDEDGEDAGDGVQEEDGGGEDDDESVSAWPGHTSTSGSAVSKGMIVVRQPVLARGGSPIACQDCGNQAKKDCAHSRCRTCCKNRGLACATHVKSTWVPAYKRRQRQEQLFSCNTDQPVKFLSSRSSRSVQPSVERVDTPEAANPTNSHTSASTETPPPSSDLNWFQQDGRFKRPPPMEVREQAVFKCVKISSVNDGIDEFAYQAVVKIGGHTYKGMLYDQGIEKGQSSASSIAELCLGGRHAIPSTSVAIDLAVNLYGSSESVLLEGNNATR